MKEQLLSADILSNGLVEDVYLITPNNSEDQSVQLAVTHLSKPDRDPGVPLVMIHGQFSNRSVWFDHQGNGLAEYLVELGFDVWMPEMRGHGLSPENQRYQENSLQDYILYDLPAIQEYLKTRTEGPFVWFGYGVSAIALSVALAQKTLEVEAIKSVVLLGVDDPRGMWRRRALNRVLRWRERIRGYIEADGLSGEMEPEAYRLIYGAENPLKSAYNLGQRSRQKEFKSGIGQLQVPLLMLAGQEVDSTPLLTSHDIYKCWGGENKTYLRYSNARSEHDMLCGQSARNHIWRDIVMWLAPFSLHTSEETKLA